MGNFPKGGGGGQTFGVGDSQVLFWNLAQGGGVVPGDKIPLNGLELFFFRFNIYSHMPNSQM